MLSYSVAFIKKINFYKWFKRSFSENIRSSHWRCSVRKGVLRNSAKFTGKHLCQSLLFKKEILVQVFSCKFCEISQITFFTEHLRTTASEICFFWSHLFCKKVSCKISELFRTFILKNNQVQLLSYCLFYWVRLIESHDIIY